MPATDHGRIHGVAHRPPPERRHRPRQGPRRFRRRWSPTLRRSARRRWRRRPRAPRRWPRRGAPTPARGVDRAGFAGRGPGRSAGRPVAVRAAGSSPTRSTSEGAPSSVRRERADGGRGPCSRNWDACDVGSLEEIFRSHEFGRGQPARREVGGVSGFRSSRGRDSSPRSSAGRCTAVPSRDVEGEAERRLSPGEGRTGDDAESRRPKCQSNPRRSSPRVAVRGRDPEHPKAPSTAPSKRHATRYGTIASVSALVALVAAGIMAGAGQHPRSSVSAQGKHDTALPQRRVQAPARRQRARQLRADRSRPRPGPAACHRARLTHDGPGSGNAPGGSVTLVGPADLHRHSGPRPRRPAALRQQRQQRGHRFPAASRQHQSRRPRRVRRREHGERRRVVGRDRCGQLGSSVPAAASTTGVVNTVVNTLDQAVSASTE